MVMQSLGLGSWRYNNALPSTTQKDVIAASAGPLIALWRFDPETHSAHRISVFEAHEDLVTVLCKSSFLRDDGLTTMDINCTASYGGEISLWSSDWSVKLGSTNVRIAKLVHISISRDGRMVAATSLYSGGLITVLRIRESKTSGGSVVEPSGLDFEFVTEMSGSYYCAEWNSDGNLFAYKEVTESSGDDNNHNSRWRQQSSSYDVMVLNMAGEELSKVRKNLRLAEVAIRNEDAESDLIALSHSKRYVEVLDMRTLETRWSFTAHGSGLMICLAFWKDSILCPSDDGNLVIWQRDYPTREFNVPSGPIFYVGWNADHDTCWLGNVGGIHVYRVSESHPLELGTSHHHSFHGLTCCGIDVHPSGQYVVAGDFACNALIWNVKTGHLVGRCLANNPIRSLCWRGSDDLIVIGCTDGSILSWKPLLSSLDSCSHDVIIDIPQPFIHFEGTITCVRWVTFRFHSFCRMTSSYFVTQTTGTRRQPNISCNRHSGEVHW